jgi:hypothetical protein
MRWVHPQVAKAAAPATCEPGPEAAWPIVSDGSQTVICGPMADQAAAMRGGDHNRGRQRELQQ